MIGRWFLQGGATWNGDKLDQDVTFLENSSLVIFNAARYFRSFLIEREHFCFCSPSNYRGGR